jgi:hypothetical protein
MYVCVVERHLVPDIVLRLGIRRELEGELMKVCVCIVYI